MLVRRNIQYLKLLKKRTQIDQLRARIAMKQAEMGTELIGHLTPQEKNLLSRSNPEIIDLKEKQTRELMKIKDEKTNLKNLADQYERTLQDEAKELEQLLSRRSMFVANQEEYKKKIEELGSISMDA